VQNVGVGKCHAADMAGSRNFEVALRAGRQRLNCCLKNLIARLLKPSRSRARQQAENWLLEQSAAEEVGNSDLIFHPCPEAHPQRRGVAFAACKFRLPCSSRLARLDSAQLIPSTVLRHSSMSSVTPVALRADRSPAGACAPARFKPHPQPPSWAGTSCRPHETATSHAPRAAA
jgi:hypothetical protein